MAKQGETAAFKRNHPERGKFLNGPGTLWRRITWIKAIWMGSNGNLLPVENKCLPAPANILAVQTFVASFGGVSPCLKVVDSKKESCVNIESERRHFVEIFRKTGTLQKNML